MKTGLVLEGGAMRGLFSAGVIDVLMEKGIEFDGAVGVSAGACFGCNYKSRQPRRAIRYNLKYCRDPRYAGLRTLIKTGDMFGADFCYHELPDKLDIFDKEAYDSNPMEFHVVATDVLTGKPVYQCLKEVDYDCCEWFRASASMPLVSRIVEVGGYKLLDGGVSDSIPLEYFRSIGYTRNVVVLTQPADYRKEKNPMLPLIKLSLGKYPAIVEAMRVRHEMYNRQLEYVAQQEKSGTALVIRPPAKLEIHKVEHDPERIKAVYKLGRKEAHKRLAEIKRFLSEPISTK